MPLRLERKGKTISSVEDWFRYAPPKLGTLQWKDGRSAKELAKAWCQEGQPPAPPSEMIALLATQPALASLTFEIGYPEHRVHFDEAGEPRRSDLDVICLGSNGRVAISVEGKADENFGRAVGEEIMGAAAQWAFQEREGRLESLRRLAALMIPSRRPGQAWLGELRYQLLTAIAGAWAFASQSQAGTAVIVVHEFLTATVDAGRIEENGRDLDRIVDRITRGKVPTVPPGHVVGPLRVPNAPAWAGVTEWYLGKCRTHLGPQGSLFE